MKKINSELNFNYDDMSLSEKYAALTGIRYFSVEDAIANAEDKDAMINKLLWQIPGGRMVVDNYMYKDLRDAVSALSDNGSSDDSGSSSDNGGEEGGEEESTVPSSVTVSVDNNPTTLTDDEIAANDLNGDGIVVAAPITDENGNVQTDEDNNPLYSTDDND